MPRNIDQSSRGQSVKTMTEGQTCGEPLWLDKNDRTVPWVLQRMKKLANKRANTLATIQSVPIYYTALAVKQSKEMAARDRNRKLATTYKNFVVPSFLKWLRDEHDYQTPSWLTMEHMGMTTFQDQDKKLFDPKKEQLWTSYQKIGREIRRNVTPWLNRWLVNSGDLTTLPSGQQHEDLMNDLMSFLWSTIDSGAPVRMRRSTFEAKLAAGAKLECVPEGIVGVGAVEVSGYGEGAGEQNDGRDIGPSSGGSQPTEHESDPMVVVRQVMPESWVHRHSLVICLFSKISTSPDKDLDLTPSSGPPNRMKRKSGEYDTSKPSDGDLSPEVPSPAFGSNRLSGEAVNLLGKAADSHSRNDAKKKRVTGEVTAAKTERTVLAQKLVARLENPPHDEAGQQQTTAISSIAASLERANKIQEDDAPRRQKALGLKERKVKLKEKEIGLKECDARIKTRNEEIKWMREKIDLLKEVGTEDEVVKAKRQLLDIYEKPLSHYVVGKGVEQESRYEIDEYSVNSNDPTGSDKAGDGSPADVTGGTPCDGLSNTSALFALASVGETLTNREQNAGEVISID